MSAVFAEDGELSSAVLVMRGSGAAGAAEVAADARQRPRDKVARLKVPSKDSEL
ncbi:hypothetical protein GCM10025759_01220 [Lysobacter panacisoli]|uniref:Uncharacterized protein n=1 Tax=Lysobacter panacisoli TaxID=1255263 RepID=A0ABP9KXH5_9GAMM